VLICPRYEKYLPLEGRLLDNKFRLIRQLGAGGMSTVWMAENVLVKKHVAIKVLHPEFAHNPRTLERFRNEATSAGRIGSDYICDILDLGQSQLGPYIVMEMLKGSNVGDFVDESPPLDPGMVVMIVRQALAGLSAAHRAGIIHRDLKPENLFLHEPSPGQLVVKIMDFGISKFTEGAVGSGKTGAGVLMGTPEYMSPEQAESAAAVDERTDIWAMGAILYFGLTGVEAFTGDRLASVLMAVINEPHTPAENYRNGLDPDLTAIIDRCLAKDPEYRVQSADELSELLAPFETEVSATGAATILGVSAIAEKTRLASKPTTIDGPPPPVSRPDAATVSTADGAQPNRDGTGGTWSTELGSSRGGGTRELDAEQSWSANGGPIDKRPETLSGGGGLGLGLLFILAIGGGVGWYLYTHPLRDGGGDDVADAEAGAGANVDEDGGADPAVKAETGGDAGGTGTETGTETGAETGTSASGEPTPDETGAEGAATSGDGADGAAGGTAGSGSTGEAGDTGGAGSGGTTGGGSSGGSTGGGSTGGGSTGGDSSGTTGGGSTPPRGPNMSKLHRVGSLYTHKTTGPSGNHAAAKSHCASLRRKRLGRLSKWRMASASQIKKFSGVVKKTRYWASGGSGSTAPTVNLLNGQTKDTDKGAGARAFCVSGR
jgi:serine/threonine-protein kinase